MVENKKIVYCQKKSQFYLNKSVVTQSHISPIQLLNLSPFLCCSQIQGHQVKHEGVFNQQCCYMQGTFQREKIIIIGLKPFKLQVEFGFKSSLLFADVT